MSPVQILFMTRKRFCPHLYQRYDGPAEGVMVTHANVLENLDTSTIGWDTEKAVSICMRHRFSHC